MSLYQEQKKSLLDDQKEITALKSKCEVYPFNIQVLIYFFNETAKFPDRLYFYLKTSSSYN